MSLKWLLNKRKEKTNKQAISLSDLARRPESPSLLHSRPEPILSSLPHGLSPSQQRRGPIPQPSAPSLPSSPFLFSRSPISLSGPAARAPFPLGQHGFPSLPFTDQWTPPVSRLHLLPLVVNE